MFSWDAKGARSRVLSGGADDWTRINHATLHIVDVTYCEVSESFVIAERTGRLSIFGAGGIETFDGLNNAWCVEAFEGALYTWTDGGVSRFKDGKAEALPIKGENHRNTCIFATPRGLFVAVDETLHRLKDGEWSAIDLAERVAELAP